MSANAAGSDGELVEVIIEIPAGSRNKYEIDPSDGRLRLERQLSTALSYPADYGFVVDTLAGDGDPLDALVMIDEPLVPGCRVTVLALGVLWMVDEEGRDPKLITVLPVDAEREAWNDVGDLPQRKLQEIEHFFNIYKDLEPGKEATTDGFAGRDAAFEQLAQARDRYSRSA